MTAPRGTTGYEPDDDFRADLTPPERPHGKGSQRDLFEALSVAHRMSADAFGSFEMGLFGGLVTRTTPNEWHPSTEEDPVTGREYMSSMGVARARSARSAYPEGGY